MHGRNCFSHLLKLDDKLVIPVNSTDIWEELKCIYELLTRVCAVRLMVLSHIWRVAVGIHRNVCSLSNEWTLNSYRSISTPMQQQMEESALRFPCSHLKDEGRGPSGGLQPMVLRQWRRACNSGIDFKYRIPTCAHSHKPKKLPKLWCT